jgi:hypothetical protein
MFLDVGEVITLKKAANAEGNLIWNKDTIAVTKSLK